MATSWIDQFVAEAKSYSYHAGTIDGNIIIGQVGSNPSGEEGEEYELDTSDSGRPDSVDESRSPKASRRGDLWRPTLASDIGDSHDTVP